MVQTTLNDIAAARSLAHHQRVIGIDQISVRRSLPVVIATLVFALSGNTAEPQLYKWKATPPLLFPATNSSDSYYSVKDPTVVSNAGTWHVFVTVRGKQRSHQIEYISFPDWNSTAKAERHFLEITNGYYCAPQVFYFTPHRKWYLLYQTVDTNRTVALQPAVSTNDQVDDWKKWSAPKFLYAKHPQGVKGWIDFWIICDDTRAHLFFTSLNGMMWRAETVLTNFPHGWTEPQVVLRGDIFEASHTYKLLGRQEYLTVVEAQRPGGRYYKAYISDRLDGEWRPLAATHERPFAGQPNVASPAAIWTESISHGELLRSGSDERLEVDPGGMRFIFQGVLDRDIQGKRYGEIPWRLGLLEAVH